MSHSDHTRINAARELGASLEPLSEHAVMPVEPVTTLVPLAGIEGCDCRIQALDAMRLEVATWTIVTVPDLEIWAQQVGDCIAELPTELLQQGWIAQFILALVERVGLSVHRASDLIQLAVGRALLTKEGW